MKKVILAIMLTAILVLTFGCSKDTAAKKLGYVPEEALQQSQAETAKMAALYVWD